MRSSMRVPGWRLQQLHQLAAGWRVLLALSSAQAGYWGLWWWMLLLWVLPPVLLLAGWPVLLIQRLMGLPHWMGMA